jgi:O-phosphoseryl-tRNA(Cys) synthetase
VTNFKFEALEKFNQMMQKEYEIKQIQLEVVENEENKEILPTQKVFKAYIGKGNNWTVVKNTLKYRNWWTVISKFNKNDTNFVWTQWLKKKILKQLPLKKVSSQDGLQTGCKMMYNRLEGNSNISNKKDLFINLTNYYKSTIQEPLNNIPLTFLIKNGIKDESFYNFCQF